MLRKSTLTIVILLSLIAPLLQIRAATADLPDLVRDNIERATVKLTPFVTIGPNAEPYYDIEIQGSGTIIQPDGLILTNYHVVDMDAPEVVEALAQLEKSGASQVEIVENLFVIHMYDPSIALVKPAFTANVVSEDEELDLALLQIFGDMAGHKLPGAPEYLPFATLGDSNQVSTGAAVNVMGYPATTSASLVTAPGTVTAVERILNSDADSWILSEARVARGNSGGAAVDDEGYLIGVPTEVTSPGCTAAGANRREQSESNDEADDCDPNGESLVRIRPINLAKPLVANQPPLPPGTEPTYGPMSGYLQLDSDPEFPSGQSTAHDPLGASVSSGIDLMVRAEFRNPISVTGSDILLYGISIFQYGEGFGGCTLSIIPSELGHISSAGDTPYFPVTTPITKFNTQAGETNIFTVRIKNGQVWADVNGERIDRMPCPAWIGMGQITLSAGSQSNADIAEIEVPSFEVWDLNSFSQQRGADDIDQEPSLDNPDQAKTPEVPAATSTETSESSVPPCSRFEAWYVDFSNRLTESSVLTTPITSAASYYDVDPETVRDIADAYYTLGQEQRDSTPPPAAVEFNDYFADNYYDELAASFDDLADAIETQDDDAINEAAIRGQAVANDFAEGGNGDELLASVLNTCLLS